jgi:hypothetical protein
VTFSFTLVLGLFLLAPGLAAFAGLYHGSKLGRVEAPPPPPGSILALLIVTIGAMVAHLAGATAFWLQDLICSRAACFRVGYEPNVYAALFNVTIARGQFTGAQVVLILFTLVLLTGLAFVSARGVVGEKALRGMLYGWLAEVALGQDRGEAVLAYVVSDVQEDGTVVGYEGVVANMTTNAEKEITSILLDSCEIFYLRVSQRGVARRKAERDSDIGQLYLDRSHIRNVAFERVKFADDE